MPSSVEPSAAYDPFAWVYERHWGGFGRRVLPVLDELIFDTLPPPAHVLDLCCGTGVLARALIDRGYRVTGVDSSSAMIDYARARAPEAKFVVMDARAYEAPDTFDAAVSTYDSLNHLLAADELEAVFRNVRRSLKAGAPFVFDLNMEQGYLARWRGSFAIVEDDHVVAVRSRYDRERKTGEMDLTIFLEEHGWRRSDLTFVQRCYAPDEVRARLERAGFEGARALEAGSDIALEERGRTFFLAHKPGSGAG